MSTAENLIQDLDFTYSFNVTFTRNREEDIEVARINFPEIKDERIPHKKCSNCFQVKPLAAFYRKLSSHQSRCKSCNAEVVRGYAARRRQAQIRARWNEIFKQ